VGFGGEAPGGELHVWFNIGLDGLDAPGLPAKFIAYLPHHLDFRPSLSGIQTADLMQLALDATEEDADKARFVAHVMALALHGAKLGVDALAFDLGPAKIEGTGHITMLSPVTWRGEAHLTASGFDDLTALAGTDPDVQRALPILIMLRGLAKPDGKRLMWDIAINGLAVTVNGIELSQLGGDRSKGKPLDNPATSQPPSR
jgi:hypothetical protein